MHLHLVGYNGLLQLCALRQRLGQCPSQYGTVVPQSVLGHNALVLRHSGSNLALHDQSGDRGVPCEQMPKLGVDDRSLKGRLEDPLFHFKTGVPLA